MSVTVPKHTWADLFTTHSARAAVMLYRARKRFVLESCTPIPTARGGKG